jgi:hypothetical protein
MGILVFIFITLEGDDPWETKSWVICLFDVAA